MWLSLVNLDDTWDCTSLAWLYGEPGCGLTSMKDLIILLGVRVKSLFSNVA